jgi:hypothetical protein
MNSFALVPARLEKEVTNGVKAQVVDKNEATGVEVVIRIDLSEWVDPEMVNLLDDNSAPLAPLTPPTPPTPPVPSNPNAITG